MVDDFSYDPMVSIIALRTNWLLCWMDKTGDNLVFPFSNNAFYFLLLTNMIYS
jgi:hypothetical protein